ncbi:MAG: Gfo/Idh/MocA family protein [Planctomycetota bacterium]
MNNRKTRVGFVGVGRMGQCAHLRNYATLGECEVVAIADLREKTAHQVAGRYGIPNVYRTHTELLEHKELDAIVASQPFERHGILLPELLAAGVPVFSEKPLAASVEVGERILAAEQQSDGWLMVGYNKRSDPATMYAKAEIDRLKQTGELGALTYVRICMPAGEWTAGGFFDLIDAGDPPPELETDPPASDMDSETYAAYGKFVNYYIHQVNLLRHLLGELYEVTYADPTGVLLVGRSKSGLPCTIEMTPYRTTVDWQESARVCFQSGTVRLDLPAPMVVNRAGRVEVLRDPGEGVTPEVTLPHLPPVHSMRQQASNFLAAVRGERPPMTTAAEALEDLKVAREYLRLSKQTP